MTDDEVILAADEAFSQLDDYRQMLERRLRGKTVRAYGSKVFRVERAEIDKYCVIALRGPVLKQDGTPHARHEYGVPARDAEFVSLEHNTGTN